MEDIIIPSIELNPPRCGVSNYKTIREYMLRPCYLDGEKKGQRLRNYTYYLYFKLEGVNKVQVVDTYPADFHPEFLSKNGVSHWNTSPLYLGIFDGEKGKLV